MQFLYCQKEKKKYKHKAILIKKHTQLERHIFVWYNFKPN